MTSPSDRWSSTSRIRRSTRSPLGVYTPEIRRVDNRLPLNALHVVEGLSDRAARDRHDHGLGVRDVTALLPDPRQLVARPLPEIREPATDVASAKHCDLHCTPSSLQSLPYKHPVSENARYRKPGFPEHPFSAFH